MQKYFNILHFCAKYFVQNILCKISLPTQSTKDKYIIIKKVRLINNNGQLDIGCALCGDFSDESCYSYGLIEDFIICTNEINEKQIHVHNTNMRELKFTFKDYKGVPITYDNEYYYSLELRI